MWISMQCIAYLVVFVAVQTCSYNLPSSSGAFRIVTRTCPAKPRPTDGQIAAFRRHVTVLMFVGSHNRLIINPASCSRDCWIKSQKEVQQCWKFSRFTSVPIKIMSIRHFSRSRPLLSASNHSFNIIILLFSEKDKDKYFKKRLFSSARVPLRFPIHSPTASSAMLYSSDVQIYWWIATVTKVKNKTIPVTGCGGP
jgi:hypothetical protein